MKLAKGRGDVLSLHLQTGHQVVFLSAFHALLRHVHSIYSPQTSLLFAPNLGEEMRKDDVPLYEMLAKEALNIMPIGPKWRCISMRYALPFRAFFVSIPIKPFSKTATFGLQNCHFCNAKRTVLECKTHHFRMQNAPF